jgi:hypothetical protein
MKTSNISREVNFIIEFELDELLYCPYVEAHEVCH